VFYAIQLGEPLWKLTLSGCELIVGLPDVNVLGVEDHGADLPLRLHIESRTSRPLCSECGTLAEVKDRPQVEFADLAVSGGRCGWCGASTGGAVPNPDAPRVRGVSTPGSRLRGWG